MLHRDDVQRRAADQVLTRAGSLGADCGAGAAGLAGEGEVMGDLETCIACGELTGRAGKGEDSIYWVDIGPWCPDCSAALRLEVADD